MIFTNVVRSVRFHFRFGGSIRSMSKRQKSGWLALVAGNWNTLLSPPPSNLSADAMANCTMKPISCNAVHQPCPPSCQSCEPTCSSNPSRSPIPETSLSSAPGRRPRCRRRLARRLFRSKTRLGVAKALTDPPCGRMTKGWFGFAVVGFSSDHVRTSSRLDPARRALSTHHARPRPVASRDGVTVVYPLRSAQYQFCNCGVV
jgi:hypothetical protein